MQVTRKLQAVHQALGLVAKQGNIEGFFRNLENVDRFSGLVEDIRDAMMEYQVCLNGASLAPLILLQTSLQQDIYDKNCQLIVNLTSLLSLSQTD